jgi:hypothetical protein
MRIPPKLGLGLVLVFELCKVHFRIRLIFSKERERERERERELSYYYLHWTLPPQQRQTLLAMHSILSYETLKLKFVLQFVLQLG